MTPLQRRHQLFESGGGYILMGGLVVLPQKIFKEVDAISRILVHFTIFLDLK